MNYYSIMKCYNDNVDSILGVTIPENQAVLFPGESGFLYSIVSSLVYLLGK